MINKQKINELLNPDLMKYPSTIETLSLDQWYTIGDLHSNPLKLLYFMITIGAATMSTADYEAYANHYITYTPPNKEKFHAMEALLAKVTFVPGASIRLIGDVFADRGRDDTAMSSVINRFKKAGGVLETILSNHDQVFIIHMEVAIYYATHDEQGAKKDFNANKFIFAFNTPLTTAVEPTDPGYTAKINHFYRSIHGLRESLNHGIIAPAVLVEQYNEYKNTLKAFSYDYPEECNGEPILYGHSAFSKQNVMLVAEQISDYLDETVKNELDVRLVELEDKQSNGELTDNDMIPLIDKINQVLAEGVHYNNISELLMDKDENLTFLGSLIENKDDPADNDVHQNHGHMQRIFGKRISLDTKAGQESEPGVFFAANIPYTKTYKTPELAKTAYAKLAGVAGSSMVTFTSGEKRTNESDDNPHPKKQRIPV